MIDLHIDDTTQFATAYLNDKPVATIQRRRIYDKGPHWKTFAMDGSLLFASYLNVSGEALARRIALCLKLEG